MTKSNADSSQSGVSKEHSETLKKDMTIISTYTVENAEVGYQLVTALRKFAEQVLSDAETYRSSSIHLSQDCRQVLVYESWTEQGQYLAMLELDDAKPHLQKIKDLCLGVDARVFEIEAVVPGKHLSKGNN